MLALRIMKMATQPQRLAIIYPKAIGDFIFVLPALHTIRRALADAHITLVIKSKQAPLALPQKGVLADEVLVLGGGSSWYNVRRQLAEINSDTIIDLAGNDQSGLIMTCRGGRRMRPDPHDCKGRCALYSPFAESMPRLPAGLHRVDELLSFARCLADTAPVHSFKMQLPAQAVDLCEQMIATRNLRSGTVVALNIGASRDTKRWPAQGFAELARILIDEGCRIVLTGANTFRSDGHYDRQLMEQFVRDGIIDEENCINLITGGDFPPDLQLQRDTHFLRYSGVPAVVVGNDTGPMQIAGSVGEDARNRTVSLFGPTNWGRYAPYDPSRRYPDSPAGEWNHVLCRDPGCRPAGNCEACKYYRSGCHHKQCMVDISPQTVADAVMSMVRKK